ncbi:MAG TPA: hypothetical protein VGS06_32540 [Streptosporangiaceae bacterium]|nr:hypothetical protein [Streptosporangiaceae bacterium]
MTAGPSRPARDDDSKLVAGYIARWRPSSVSPQAAAFARQAVPAAGPGGQERAKNLLWAAAKLADYAIGLGLDPVPEVLLHPSVIERFARCAPGLSPVTRRTLRTNLRFIARQVVPQLLPADARGGVGRQAGAARQLDPVAVVDIPEPGELGRVMAIHCQRTSSWKPSNSPARVPYSRCWVSSRRRTWFSALSSRSGVGDNALGQAVALQQRLELGPETWGGQLGAQEQRDHLRFAAWPQPPHTHHLAPASRSGCTAILPAWPAHLCRDQRHGGHAPGLLFSAVSRELHVWATAG